MTAMPMIQPARTAQVPSQDRLPIADLLGPAPAARTVASSRANLLSSPEAQRRILANGGAIELAKALVGLAPANFAEVGPYIAQVLASVVNVLPKNQQLRGLVLRQIFNHLQQRFPQFVFGEFNFGRNIVFYGQRAGVFVTPGGDVYHGRYPEFDERTGHPDFWSPSNTSIFQQVLPDLRNEFRGKRPQAADWLRQLRSDPR